jgi:AcrR family transcriptional regulator
MARQSRRDENAAATRAAIVAAAVTRFAANGFSATTVDEIAAEARVTKGGVYYHFDDKATLFEAAFCAVEERLLERLAARVAGMTMSWELVAVGIDDYLAACCEDAFRRIALEDAPGALGWPRWRQLEERFFLGTATTLLEELSHEGLIALDDGPLTARLLLGALTEAGLAVADASDSNGQRARASALVMRLLRGLQPAAS